MRKIQSSGGHRDRKASETETGANEKSKRPLLTENRSSKETKGTIIHQYTHQKLKKKLPCVGKKQRTALGNVGMLDSQRKKALDFETAFTSPAYVVVHTIAPFLSLPSALNTNSLRIPKIHDGSRVSLLFPDISYYNRVADFSFCLFQSTNSEHFGGNSRKLTK